MLRLTRYVLVFLVSLKMILPIAAQTNTDKQLWLFYLQQGNFNRKWGYWFNLQHRNKNDFIKSKSVDMAALGITYSINKKFRVAGGYAMVFLFPQASLPEFVRQEHRIWQFVSSSYNKDKIRLNQILRNEQRILQKISNNHVVDGYLLRDRMGYNVMFQYALNNKKYQKGGFGISLNEEVFVNLFAADHAKFFDQNRAFAGMYFQITDKLQLQAGYLNFKTLSTLADCFRISFFHKLDWKQN